jgi:RHS repeat-associated protein
VVEYSYNPWGEILSITGTMADTIGQQNPLRYRGYYYDNETGLYYLQSRYYDPVTGRFLNADVYVDTEPGSPLSTNMYAYCENNALNRYDSNGIWYEDIFDFDQHLSSITNNE